MLKIFGDTLTHITWKFSVSHIFFNLFNLFNSDWFNLKLSSAERTYPKEITLPFLDIVVYLNPNFGSNWWHDPRIEHSKLRPISSIASLATCQLEIVVGI